MSDVHSIQHGAFFVHAFCLYYIMWYSYNNKRLDIHFNPIDLDAKRKTHEYNVKFKTIVS